VTTHPTSLVRHMYAHNPLKVKQQHTKKEKPPFMFASALAFYYMNWMHAFKKWKSKQARRMIRKKNTLINPLGAYDKFTDIEGERVFQFSLLYFFLFIITLFIAQTRSLFDHWITSLPFVDFLSCWWRSVQHPAKRKKKICRETHSPTRSVVHWRQKNKTKENKKRNPEFQNFALIRDLLCKTGFA